MSDISEFESRITMALDRIRSGLEDTSASMAGSAQLQAELTKERTQNAELVQRVAILKDRQDTEVASLSKRVEMQSRQMQKLDGQLQSLKAHVAQLLDMNAQLRASVTEGLTPELLDQAVQAEMAALTAQRATEAAELEAILAELKPLIVETRDAAN